MKKLIYTAATIFTLGFLASCTKDEDVAPASAQIKLNDTRDKSDVGTADMTGEDSRDKSDVGTADLRASGEDQRDKSDVGTADFAGDESRDKSDVGTADISGK